VRRDSLVGRCGILVRPHPANAEPWDGVNLGDIENAAVWTEAPKVQADPALYDSLYHCAGTVGLNTSAMIEAGILDKPVFTIQTTEFAGGQDQTLHFHYLLARNGGHVEAAADLEQHVRQLGESLAHPTAGIDRRRRFIESFVRPRGIGLPVAPIMVDEIERVARLRKPRRRSPLWHYPARRALLTFLRHR
jgi:hypothetical protein